MMSFEVRCSIDASPECVWARLTDAQTLVAGHLGVLEKFANGLRALAEDRR